MKNKKLFYLLIGLALYSCDKNDTKVIEPIIVTEPLSRWEWFKSEIIWPQFIVITPASAGYTHRLEFINETQLKMSYFHADTTIQMVCDYVIQNNSITICNSRYGFWVKTDTLILSQAYVDGPITYYKKMSNH